jgi:hypothetical protein
MEAFQVPADDLWNDQDLILTHSHRERQLLRSRQRIQELTRTLNQKGEESRTLTDALASDLTDEEKSTLSKFNERQVPSRTCLEELLEWLLTIIAIQRAQTPTVFSEINFVLALNDREALEAPGRWLGFLNPELEHTIRRLADPVKWVTQRTSGKLLSRTIVVSDYSEASLKRVVGRHLLLLNRAWVASMTKVLGSYHDSPDDALFSWMIPDAFSFASLSSFVYDVHRSPLLLSVQETTPEEVCYHTYSLSPCYHIY